MKILALAATALLASAAMAQDGPSFPITRAQALAAVQSQFRMLDANHDGVVTQAEFDAYRAQQGDEHGDHNPFTHVGGRWFEHADKDGTGRVTLEQAEKRPMKLFDMADANHDGVVTEKEAKMAMAMSHLGK